MDVIMQGICLLLHLLPALEGLQHGIMVLSAAVTIPVIYPPRPNQQVTLIPAESLHIMQVVFSIVTTQDLYMLAHILESDLMLEGFLGKMGTLAL